MKNAKKASGISYSSAAIVLILAALTYGFYKKVAESRAEVRSTGVPSTDVLEHQVEQKITSSNDKVLGLTSESKSNQKPSESAADIEEASAPFDENTSAAVPALAKALKSWSSDDFKDLMKRTQADLPILADFKKLSPKEVHHTPEILNRAGTKLGLIAEVLDANPDFAPIAQEFYQDCLVRKDLPTSIRALCLANHRNLRVSQGDSPDWREDEVRTTTTEIRELAEHIPLK